MPVSSSLKIPRPVGIVAVGVEEISCEYDFMKK